MFNADSVHTNLSQFTSPIFAYEVLAQENHDRSLIETRRRHATTPEDTIRKLARCHNLLTQFAGMRMVVIKPLDLRVRWAKSGRSCASF